MAVGWFYLSVLALCSLGSMCILFTIYWMRYWHGGFAWDGSILMFNWHPVLMVTGMVVLYSAGEYGSAADTWPGPGPCGAALSSHPGLCYCRFRAVREGWDAVGCLWAQLTFGRSLEN